MPNVEFTQISEQEFLDKVDLSKVKYLFILGHTGKQIYREVHKRLGSIAQHKKGFPEEIRILIRDPFAEGLRRHNYIHSTITEINDLRLKGKNIDVRFYESAPAFRGVICEFQTNDRVSYMASYDWPQINNSKAFEYAYMIRDSVKSPRPEVRLLKSWIDQYWGMDEIHTVVFDFDDTLVSTGEIQIKSWAQVIEDCLGKKIIKPENLSSKLRGFVDENRTVNNKRALLEAIKTIFIDKQLAEAIVQDLFVDISNETIKQINEKRFEIREGMMNQTELFDGVGKFLEQSCSRYNFAIISSTDEQMISDYLKEKGLYKYFSIILGKKDPSLKHERENIYHKASLLIKLSELIGIPLSRLVYVGDNNSDYLATRQLGVTFIEARQAAKLMGKDSFVTDIDLNKPPLGYFENFETDQRLTSALNEHSRSIARSKYRN